MSLEFEAVLQNVKNGLPGEITRMVEGNEYHRRFIPKDRLILLGGGYISQAVCMFAAKLEFEIIAVDDRPAFANRAIFPEADEIICDNFIAALDRIGVRATDYVCVMTRGHRHDAACVRHVLSGVMPYYLGMIGSKRRVADFLEVLREENYGEELLEQLHAPIGLNIHAMTTEEIGLSICAELVAERRRLGKHAMDGILPQTDSDPQVLEYLAKTEEPHAFVLVYETTGSTPAKAGAVMAVNALGKTYGTVGGGCSEAEIIVKARRLIGTGKTDIVEIDMTNDVAEEIGMVCGGRLWAYIEDNSNK